MRLTPAQQKVLYSVKIKQQDTFVKEYVPLRKLLKLGLIKTRPTKYGFVIVRLTAQGQKEAEKLLVLKAPKALKDYDDIDDPKRSMLR